MLAKEPDDSGLEDRIVGISRLFGGCLPVLWCIPQVDGEFVTRMEDVLGLYAQAPDPKRPL
jgi:hypothetical protein